MDGKQYQSQSCQHERSKKKKKRGKSGNQNNTLKYANKI